MVGDLARVRRRGRRRRFGCDIQFDLNFSAVFTINLEKHRGFYDHFPRSYWPWVGVNLIEFAVTIGVARRPASPLAFGAANRRPVLAWRSRRRSLRPRLTGKNLSEAARLWLFLTPLAAAAARRLLERETLGATARLHSCSFFQAVAGDYASMRPSNLCFRFASL